MRKELNDRTHTLVDVPSIDQKVLGSSISVTNSTAPVAVPGLQVVLDSAKRYRVDYDLFIAGVQDQGIKLLLVGTASPTYLHIATLLYGNSYDGIESGGITTDYTTSVGNIYAGAAPNTRATISAYIENLTGGALDLKFAQEAALAATSATILKGSKVTIHRIDD
jgi:hypothetical protein